ncbi:uncharacterized protein K452DRAFT_40361 [Aplosporella prunicola CBS 121167]|uniref:Uncharacterized protein n=1 Tax=Aplosporella prunicola CBS 121167 TaxID=1176127 RepID=A0A6A6BBC9_9PEZI|nr:uncharacterized protein K452DRAFT_40361 [Aplosporella prunicola CBS 121167]KAF2141509.1 hypothetical protein K452DRAFT_40361 [Aplosporella prunicola CBS 121167]
MRTGRVYEGVREMAVLRARLKLGQAGRSACLVIPERLAQAVIVGPPPRPRLNTTASPHLVIHTITPFSIHPFPLRRISLLAKHGISGSHSSSANILPGWRSALLRLLQNRRWHQTSSRLRLMYVASHAGRRAISRRPLRFVSSDLPRLTGPNNHRLTRHMPTSSRICPDPCYRPEGILFSPANARSIAALCFSRPNSRALFFSHAQDIFCLCLLY